MTNPSSLQEAIAGLPASQAERMKRLAEERGEEFVLELCAMVKSQMELIEKL